MMTMALDDGPSVHSGVCSFVQCNMNVERWDICKRMYIFFSCVQQFSRC